MKAVKDSGDVQGMVDFVPFFKAFCNSTRAQIMEFLLGGERCVCEMTGPLDQSQPLVSHHLALLRKAGLVHMRNEGARTYYSIDRERFDGDLEAFLGYVERLRSAPPVPNSDDSACAVRKKPASRRKAS
jgi:ArsR family transcriptional regulator, arsenate/arsenite/antimonite-responsive transcriptional repressor